MAKREGTAATLAKGTNGGIAVPSAQFSHPWSDTTSERDPSKSALTPPLTFHQCHDEPTPSRGAEERAVRGRAGAGGALGAREQGSKSRLKLWIFERKPGLN